MSSPIDCWRSLTAELRRRLREIRGLPPCYKIGLPTPGPDDVITADDRWHSPASGDPLDDLRAAKEAFQSPMLEPDEDGPFDLRDIN